VETEKPDREDWGSEMAGCVLRTILLVCAAVLVAADVVVYDEDLNKDHVPGLTAHAWTMVDDGRDGASNVAFQGQTSSLDGTQDTTQFLSNLLEQQNGMLQEMGFRDPAVFGGGDATGFLGFRSSNAFDWAAQQVTRMQNFHDTLFSSPCIMQDALANFMQSSWLVAPDAQDQTTYPHLRAQMLQNVACTRFGPALTAAKLQDDNTLVSRDSGDSSTDWDIEVTFYPLDPQVQDGDENMYGMQMAQTPLQGFLAEDKLFVENAKVEDSPSERSRFSLWGRIVFFTLLFGSIFTLLICIRQCCELRRAMKEMSKKAEDDVENQEDANEKKPLLSKKGWVVDDDGYTNLMIQPVQSEPALKAMYPVALRP